MRLRRFRYLAQGHRGDKWQSWDSGLELLNARLDSAGRAGVLPVPDYTGRVQALAVYLGSQQRVLEIIH